MRIYFEDGGLRNGEEQRLGCDISIDAGDGYSNNNRILEILDKKTFDRNRVSVYTNSLVAISNSYCWNDETNRPEIYFRSPKTGDFVHVYELTNAKIRRSQNLLAMYRSGVLR